MRLSSSLVAAAGFLSTANAAIKGFNYGANFGDGRAKTLMDFEYEFNAAKTLPGTNGWTSARLYTMIQHGTQTSVIEAIQAAINTNTTLLLGMWASAGQATFDNEIAALKAAITQYGTAFTDLVEGISVGSEDLYRITPTGIENKSGPGAQPKDLIDFVQKTRKAIRGTPLERIPIGHVDTWTVYVNATNNEFISSLDFLGVDAYPYFQTTMTNNVGSGSQLFFDAYHQTVAAAQGKPVWVTETGWPVSGDTLNQAVPSLDNARIYWEDVVCQLVADNVNLYYYILQDVQFGNPVPSFGIKPGGDLQAVSPLFDLSCPASSSSSTLLPSTTTQRSSSSSSSSSIFGLPTSTGVVTTRLSTTPSTSRPTTVTVPVVSTPASPSSSDLLKPTQSSSSVHLIDLPMPTGVPEGLRGSFEAPHVIVPIDKSNPSNVIGNGFTANLTSTISTVFVFDVRPEQEGKLCNLVFFMPSPFQFPDTAPVHLRSPGGIAVARLDSTDTIPKISFNSVGSSTPVGNVPSIEPANEYTINSVTCEAGKRVAYQVDSIGGLTMDFFQLTSPPLGLFMIPH